MPLVRIDLNANRSSEDVRAIADTIHDVIVAEYGIPVRDRFQIITERAPGTIIAEDAGLGFERTDQVIVIQIFTQRGRTTEAKQSLFAGIAAGLGTLGVAGEDVFIGYVENGPDDWSFGFGRSQYVTGELAVPRPPE